MRKYKIIIILILSFFILCGCNSNNTKIRIYEEKINKIINEESLDKRINLILDFEENIKKEEELVQKINNYSEYKSLKQNIFYNRKKLFSYEKYLSKTVDYLSINDITNISNINEINIRKSNETKEDMINDNKFINKFISIVNTQYSKIIKYGQKIIYDYLLENSKNIYNIILSNIEIKIFENGYVYITDFNNETNESYISLFSINYSELNNYMSNVKKETFDTGYFKIELYDKDLNLLRVIRTQKEIKEYIIQYEKKVFKEFDQMIFNPGSDEVELNPEYVDCLEMLKQLDRIFIYTSDNNYIKLYNYNNEKLYYFSGYYGLMVGE